jgi:hypothetical protein
MASTGRLRTRVSIAGHPRGAKGDVGAEQFSASPGLRHVLTTADVGPMAP